MKHKTVLCIAAISLMATPLVYSATELWSTEGFSNPESALYDSARDVIYVSNVDGGPADKNGKGHISRLSVDGTLQDAKWVKDLNAPKGLVQFDQHLYVTDIDQLIAIHLVNGKVDGKWDAEGAKFLNDLAVDEEGRVYVSDMLTNSIYRLEGHNLSLWLQHEDLQHPNGLKIDGDRLLIAPWGKDLQEDFSTKVPGHLIAVDLNSKVISTVGSGEPVGNLDGLESDGKGNWLVTDWIAGALFRIDSEGNADMLLDMNQGSADIGVINDKNMVLVPMMMDNKVIAVTLE